jgi:hypothetical protein
MSRMARIALAVLLALGGVSCGAPSFVERITIVNPNEYDVLAEVSDGSSGWLHLGTTIERESEEMIEQVADMGERWVFRFRFRDLEQEQVTLSRAALSSAGWRVEVPESLAERLRTRGEPPSFSGG